MSASAAASGCCRRFSKSEPYAPRLRPRRLGRQRHQDRLYIAAGLQPKAGTPIIEQVEFDIAAAAHKLMAALFVGPRQPHARPHDRRISTEERFADPADKGKIALPVTAVEIIEKDPAGAARFVAMLKEKIFVAPLFEPDMAFRVVTVAGGCAKRRETPPLPPGRDRSASDRRRRRTTPCRSRCGACSGARRGRAASAGARRAKSRSPKSADRSQRRDVFAELRRKLARYG